MKCSFDKDLRDVLFGNIRETYNIDTLCEDEIFILIMSACEYDTIRPVIDYVKEAFFKCVNIDV